MYTSNQQVFDLVVTHLLTQGRRAEDVAGGCMYRAPEGMKCAVGFLLPDSEYRPEMEGEAAGSGSYITPVLQRIGVDLDLATSLQIVHDKQHPSDWVARLRIVADHYRLSADVVDTFSQTEG